MAIRIPDLRSSPSESGACVWSLTRPEIRETSSTTTLTHCTYNATYCEKEIEYA